MDGERRFWQGLIALSILTTAACTPQKTSEHHKIDVTACAETGLVDGKCDGPDDEPLNILVNIKDMAGNTLVKTTTNNGKAVMELDTRVGKLLDLGWNPTIINPFGNGLLCTPSNPIVTSDGINSEVILAFSNCIKPEVLQVEG